MSKFSAPSAVVQIGQKLVDAGHASFLVGPGLRDLLIGISPSHFELSTDATLREILDRFSNGVLIENRRNSVMVPSPAGPVDVSPFRAGAHIEDDLAHRDFTVNAIAYDIASTVWFARCEVHEIASTRIRSARFGGFGSQRRGAGSWIRRSRTRSRAPRVRSPISRANPFAAS